MIGKVELSAPLGADRTTALRKLPAAVAAMHDRIDAARAKLKNKTSEPWFTPSRFAMGRDEECRQTHRVPLISRNTRSVISIGERAGMKRLRLLLSCVGEVLDKRFWRRARN